MNPPSGCLRYFKDVVIISSGLISGYVQGQLQPQYGMIVKSEQVPTDYLEQLIKMVQKKNIFHITQICRVHSAKQKTKYILTIVPKAQLTMQVDQMLNLQQLMSLGLLKNNITLFTSILYQILHKVNEMHTMKLIHAALVPSNIYMNVKSMKLLIGPPLGLSRPFLSHSAPDELRLSTPPELASGQFRSVSWKTDCYQIGYTLLCLVHGSIINDPQELVELVNSMNQTKKQQWCGAINIIAITRLLSSYNERPRVGSVLECLTDGLIMQQEQFCISGGERRRSSIYHRGRDANIEAMAEYDSDQDSSVSPGKVSLLAGGPGTAGTWPDEAEPISMDNHVKKPRNIVEKHKKMNNNGARQVSRELEAYQCFSTSSPSSSTSYEVVSPPGRITMQQKAAHASKASHRLEQNKREIQWLMHQYKELARVIALEQKRHPDIIKRLNESSGVMGTESSTFRGSGHREKTVTTTSGTGIQNLIARRSGYVFKLHRFCFRGHDEDKRMNVSCRLFTQGGGFYGERHDVVFRALPCEGVSVFLNDCYIELRQLDVPTQIPDGPLTKKLSQCRIMIFEQDDEAPKTFEFNFVSGQSQDPQWCSAIGSTDRIQVSIAVL